MNNIPIETKPTKLLSKDPNRAMQEMMNTIDALRLALVEETNALKDADTPKFLSLQDKKLNVARDYLDGMAQLLARTDELKNANPLLKNKLEKMRVDFSETAHQNFAAIERMKKGMKRLGEHIMKKAQEAAKKEEELTYGATGRMYSGLRASVGVSETA